MKPLPPAQMKISRPASPLEQMDTSDGDPGRPDASVVFAVGNVGAGSLMPGRNPLSCTVVLSLPTRVASSTSWFAGMLGLSGSGGSLSPGTPGDVIAGAVVR